MIKQEKKNEIIILLFANERIKAQGKLKRQIPIAMHSEIKYKYKIILYMWIIAIQAAPHAFVRAEILFDPLIFDLFCLKCFKLYILYLVSLVAMTVMFRVFFI